MCLDPSARPLSGIRHARLVWSVCNHDRTPHPLLMSPCCIMHVWKGTDYLTSRFNTVEDKRSCEGGFVNFVECVGGFFLSLLWIIAMCEAAAVCQCKFLFLRRIHEGFIRLPAACVSVMTMRKCLCHPVRSWSSFLNMCFADYCSLMVSRLHGYSGFSVSS